MKRECLSNEVCVLQIKETNETNDNHNPDLSCSNFSMLESFNQFEENNGLLLTQPTLQKFENEIVFTTKFNYKMFQNMKNHFSTLFKVKYNDEYFQKIYNNQYFEIAAFALNMQPITCLFTSLCFY